MIMVEKKNGIDNAERLNEIKNITIQTLKEIFQFDNSELDFGIYRILNLKKKEISKFIEKDLFKIIEEDMGQNEEKDSEFQEEILDHIVTFFSRYYDNGDIISKRRYSKDNKYAIPYNGEEVYMYWANHDQYYIKTGENFTNYSFKAGDWKINFEITADDIDIEKANIKDSEKKFFLFHNLKSSSGNNLNIYFGYRRVTEEEEKLVKKVSGKNSIRYDYVNQYNIKILNEKLEISTIIELKEKHRNPNGESLKSTELEWHLDKFTAKNTADYFIHKNLHEFLSRELDFYIKNEIFKIDEVNTSEILKLNLTKISVFKSISLKIIEFLSHIEDFQKKLWEKKKFIIKTNYCITLDYIDTKHYSTIIQNHDQLNSWKELFSFDLEKKTKISKKELLNLGKSNDQIKMELLIDNPTLVIDTKFFDNDFKFEILSEISNLDENINGILINSENFHGLNLLLNKYKEKINCCYIDPPYNTASSEILYKNNYKNSSWISLMYDRIKIGEKLIREDGFMNITIDYAELFNLGKIADDLFGDINRIGILTILINPKGRQHERFFCSSTEYMLVYAKNVNKAIFNKVTIDDEKAKDFSLKDKNGKYRLDPFARIRSSTKRALKKSSWYPIYVSKDLTDITIQKKKGYFEVFPVNNQGEEYSWKVQKSSFEENNKKGLYVAQRNGDKLKIYNKYYEQQVLPNIWTDKKYFPEFQGTNLLKNLFGESNFSYPKSVFAVKDTCKIMSKDKDIVLDFFAGSGTTGHAILKLNKEDGGKRKFILVEMGQYFDTVTKPKILKIIYSDNWKKGKPQDNNGSKKQIVKYHSLEQYEDSLLNIDFKIPNQLAVKSKDYKFKYMLDFESKDNPIFLNLDLMDNPFDYRLKIETKNGVKKQKVDLIETFNYLAGIFVDRIFKKQDGVIDYIIVLGLRDGKNVIVIWRNKIDNFDPKRDKEFIENKIIKQDEFDEIFVNGSSLIENAISLDIIFKEEMMGG